MAYLVDGYCYADIASAGARLASQGDVGFGVTTGGYGTNEAIPQIDYFVDTGGGPLYTVEFMPPACDVLGYPQFVVGGIDDLSVLLAAGTVLLAIAWGIKMAKRSLT